MTEQLTQNEINSTHSVYSIMNLLEMLSFEINGVHIPDPSLNNTMQSILNRGNRFVKEFAQKTPLINVMAQNITEKRTAYSLMVMHKLFAMDVDQIVDLYESIIITNEDEVNNEEPKIEKIIGEGEE